MAESIWGDLKVRVLEAVRILDQPRSSKFHSGANFVTAFN
jgi:hypothetical protein